MTTICFTCSVQPISAYLHSHKAIAVHVAGVGNEVTAMACAVYFWARVAYAPLYYFEVPYVKTTAWMIGLMATPLLAYELLK